MILKIIEKFLNLKVSYYLIKKYPNKQMKEKINIDQTANIDMKNMKADNDILDFKNLTTTNTPSTIVPNEARKRIDAALGLLKLKNIKRKYWR